MNVSTPEPKRPRPDTEPAPLLPGVTLAGELSRSDHAVVYTGSLDLEQTQVAVKILRPGIEPGLVRRFHDGCTIQRGLSHASILPLLRDGVHHETHYALTPLQAGGNLLDALGLGLSLQALFKHLKDIARALDYLHERGVVHGDVKPENILFSGAGRALLGDFDIAREISPDDIVTAGTLHASPEYSAPELVSGRAVDGRADLYSLGVVFYRMLVGAVPHSGSTVLEILQKHQQEPAPRLPSHLADLQPLMESLLAKRVDQRIESGAELVAQLDQIRRNGRLPVPTLRTGSISTQEISALSGGGLLTTGSERSRLDRSRSRARARRIRRVAVTLTLLGGVGAAAYYGWQSNLVDPERLMTSLGIAEDPRVAAAWNDAQSLRQDPNQALTAIVAAYRRVLALDPDYDPARLELASLATDWKDTIGQALTDSNLQLAETRLAEANDVFPTDLGWLQLRRQLDDLQRAERILANTERLLASNGLSDVPSATAAIQSYQEVLRLAPSHPAALDALRELSAHYAGMATQAVSRGEVDVAISLLERASAADRTLPVLDDVRTQISRATRTQAAIEELLQAARRLRSQGVLFATAGAGAEGEDSAVKLYHRVLALDPANVIAQQGLVEITSQVAEQADQLLADGQLAAVDNLVSQAAAEGLVEEGVDEVRRRLVAERQRLKTVSDNIDAAKSHMASGYLTAPPEANAVAKLREVQQIDPGNTEAEQLLRVCAERLAAVATEAHGYGLVDEAKQYLDLALAIQPDVAEWIALREGWEGETP